MKLLRKTTMNQKIINRSEKKLTLKNSTINFENEEIEKIERLIKEIDINDTLTCQTNKAASSGTIITVYDAGKEITLNDFYTFNMSQASKEINQILRDKNILK